MERLGYSSLSPPPVAVSFRGGPVPLRESERPLLGVFLACTRTGSYLLLCEAQSPAHDLRRGAPVVLKNHCFFGRAVSAWTWAGTWLPHILQPPPPGLSPLTPVLYLSF